MRKKRVLPLMVVLVLLFSGVSALATNEAINPKGILPIVKDGYEVELTIFVSDVDLVTTYESPTNLYTQWVEDQTGLKLNFVTAPESDEAQKLSLLLNTNDYPDIIFSDVITSGTAALYAEEGVFIPLDDLYEEYGDNLVVQYENYPMSWETNVGFDGSLIGVANINDCLHCNVSEGRAWYYFPFMKAYIEATGKSEPQTTEEYKDFLIWVRDNDANGNGDPSDEIPLASFAKDLPTLRRWAANSFLPYPLDGYAVLDGKVEAQFMKDEYRDSIRYLADLYAEGLIMPESFSLTKEELIRLGESPEPIIASVAVQGRGDWCEKLGASERFFYTWLLPTLAGPDGVQYTFQKGAIDAVDNYAYITDKCENPDAAFRLIDFMKSTEAVLNGYIGPKGMAWDDPDEGALGLNGEPALYKLLVTYGTQPDDISWNHHQPDYRSSEFRLGEQAEGSELINEFLVSGDAGILQQIKDLVSYNEVSNFYWAEAEKDHLLPQEMIPPVMLLSDAENKLVADIKASMDAYIDLAYVEFITGVRNIDDDAAWETYINDLKNMGVETICEIYTDNL